MLTSGTEKGHPAKCGCTKNGIMHIKRLPLMAQWTTHSKVFGSDLGWTGRYEATPRRRVSIFKLHAHQSVPKSILRALSKQFPRVDEFYVFT
jgi:hypothetical protein